MNTVKFGLSKIISLLKQDHIKFRLIAKSVPTDANYVRYCEFNGMVLTSGLLSKEENKYRDTVVVTDDGTDQLKYYHIELIFHTNQECTFIFLIYDKSNVRRLLCYQGFSLDENSLKTK